MIEFLFETARTVTDFILTSTAQRFGRMRLIVPHLGGVLPLLTERVELFRTINGEPADRTTVAETLGQFYYDLAGTPSKFQIAAPTSIAKPTGCSTAATTHGRAVSTACIYSLHLTWRLMASMRVGGRAPPATPTSFCHSGGESQHRASTSG